jgi:hypothetical protein
MDTSIADRVEIEALPAGVVGADTLLAAHRLSRDAENHD